jgi:hypothetical protein
MRPINETEREEFQALASGEYDNFAIVSTEYDGEETVVIAAVVPEDGDEATFSVHPLYVRLTPAMFARLQRPDTDMPPTNGKVVSA